MLPLFGMAALNNMPFSLKRAIHLYQDFLFMCREKHFIMKLVRKLKKPGDMVQKWQTCSKSTREEYPKREHVSSYNTRNKEDYIIPRCRLQLFRNSFIPDALKQWNLLKVEVRDAISIHSLRKKWKSIFIFFFWQAKY